MRELTQFGDAPGEKAKRALQLVATDGRRCAAATTPVSSEEDGPQAAALKAFFAEHEPSIVAYTQALCDRGITVDTLASITEETVRCIPGLGTADKRIVTVEGRRLLVLIRRLQRLRTQVPVNESAEERPNAILTPIAEGANEKCGVRGGVDMNALDAIPTEAADEECGLSGGVDSGVDMRALS